ncbi:Uma2 family endonuclease [Anaerotruncus sp. 1XD42-93]|uniref:Uma2 family endonuclease n=1 Tax=Anaerotruncus sp. 1XD42-93 TaxID=2320853 RepID=UPI000EA2209D|nr:Uma2 family endonuclease [Anaerotruncus sp. 1XD42-93]NBK18457.1 Uma2 family endonuclease [Anaerotruncus sp. 1XD42-93]RKJ86549.1 Uma2 family endonuclease [Anaerotruncus sp. 1XD22-93]
MNGNLAYKEDWREELIGGKVVAMSPRPTFNHNRVASRIYWIFESYLRGHACTPIADGTDLYLSEADLFVPDFMIVCDRNKIKSDGVHGAPDLVVEVISPSTVNRDRGYKKDQYAKCGVQEYWIANPVDRSIEIYLFKNNELGFDRVYTVHPDWMLAKMSEEERAAVETHFKCSLFDDFDISLDDIFSGLLP